MQVHVLCSTFHNSKVMESTQMPINDGVDKENVAHMHHGILCSHKKRWVHFLCRDTEETGNHHSQQTDTRTENQTLHVLTHKWVLNNENTWTQRGEHHTLGSGGWGAREGIAGGGRLGRDNRERNARSRWRGDGGSKPHCHACTYATILHVLHIFIAPKVQYIYVCIYVNEGDGICHNNIGVSI